MTKEQELPDFAEYISIAEAAIKLNISRKRVHIYIEQGRLITLKIANIILVSKQSVQEFQVKTVTGRPRTQIPLWRKSPPDGTFVVTLISVKMRSRRQERLMEVLDQMRQENQHLFFGTVERYIAEDDDNPGMIEIHFVWKQNEMPDEATYKQQLAAFQETFAEVLDWDTARYSTKTVLLHT